MVSVSSHCIIQSGSQGHPDTRGGDYLRTQIPGGTEDYRNNSLSHGNDSEGRERLPRGRRKFWGEIGIFLY